MPAPIAPIVHLNGTSADRLAENLLRVYSTLQDAYQHLKQAAPNGRDYYVGAPGLFEAAVDQHRRRQQTLDSLINEIADEINAIQNQ